MSEDETDRIVEAILARPFKQPKRCNPFAKQNEENGIKLGEHLRPRPQETASSAMKETPSSAMNETPSSTMKETPSSAMNETPSSTMKETPSSTMKETPSLAIKEKKNPKEEIKTEVKIQIPRIQPSIKKSTSTTMPSIRDHENGILSTIFPKMDGGDSLKEKMIAKIKAKTCKLASRRYSQLLTFVDACMFGIVDTILYMLYKEYINVNDELMYNMSGLQHACFAGQFEVVKLFLELGAKPNYKRKTDGFTVLMAACFCCSDNKESVFNCVHAVVTAGSKLDVAQPNGMSALLYAVQRGHTRVVEFLLDKGADIDHVNIEGHDAMFYAKCNRDSGMIALLRRHMWVKPEPIEAEYYEINGDTDSSKTNADT